MFNIVLLGITSLLTDISSEMVYPLIPLYLVGRLGASPGILGLVEGVAETTSSLLKVFSGHLSDRITKRKPFALCGYSLSGVGKLLLYLSTSWGHLFFARFSDRFGKGVRTAPRDALISESCPPEGVGAAFGLHRAMDTAGAALGVFLAWLIFTSGSDEFRKVFLFSLIPALLGVAVLSLVRERGDTGMAPSKVRYSPRSLLHGFRALDRRLKTYLLITLIFTLGNSSNHFILLRSTKAGFSSSDVLLLYLLFNMVYALVSWPAGRLSDRIGKRALLTAGYLLYSLVYLGFGIDAGRGSVIALFALYGVYAGLTEGVEKAYISELSPEQGRATLLGLHATITGIGLLPASLLAGLLWNLYGFHAPFIFGSAASLLAGILLFFISHVRR